MEHSAVPPIETSVASALVTEAYPSRPQIAGVEWLPLRKHRDEEGYFMELLRLDSGLAHGLLVRQLSITQAAPGRMNAFHLHHKRIQDEMWCVVAGRMLVWLVDVRADSETRGVRQRWVLSGEEPGWLRIPTGVAHGYRAAGDGATLVYAMNDQFDIADPNEGRLPWDHFGAELWEPNRG